MAGPSTSQQNKTSKLFFKHIEAFFRRLARLSHGIPKVLRQHPRFVRGLKIGGVVVCTSVLVALNVAASLYGETVDSFLGRDLIDVTQQQVDDQMKQGAHLAQELEAEGIVLLQNNDQALPLSADTKQVNVFGWASTAWVSAGSGSGGISGEALGFLDALTDAGVLYNTELTQMYTSFKDGRPYLGEGTLNTYAKDFCTLYEPSIFDRDYYTTQMLANAKEFSNTAIVVLGRMAGESIDCPTVQYTQSTKDGRITQITNRHYLQPSREEEQLLRYVAANYQNVIVVVNSTNTMELGLLEQLPGVDAVVWAQATGAYGAAALPQVLWGNVNPSGRTTDTFAYKMATSAAWANSGEAGEGTYLESEGYYPANGTKNVNVGEAVTYDAVRYVDYAENIYVGYRWYETADKEGYWDHIYSPYGSGYKGVVQYPFGYGLSYTTFSWSVIDRTPQLRRALDPYGSVSVVVRVTNTGTVAGKDVVELYATPPYYKGGIEKASTILVAFEKTALLQPGESQDITLSFNVSQLASYDCYDANHNGFCGYELEAGTYTVELKRNAHELAQARGATKTYYLSEPVRYQTNMQTGTAVNNAFTGETAVDGISVDGSSVSANITYVTRANFEDSFPAERAPNRVFDEALKKTSLYSLTAAQKRDAAYDEVRAAEGLDVTETVDDAAEAGKNAQVAVSTSENSVQVATGKLMLARSGKLTALGRALGTDYNDGRWDNVLSQLTLDQMETLVLHGYSNTARLDNVGKPKTKDLDGPSQAGSFHQLKYGTGFPNATVIAQTWNKSLARSFGQAVGMECAMLGIDGWYAPSCNLHRTPLGGRNYEYYSEDPLLSGVFAARVIQGSKESGTYTYLKHFAVNEQDSYRDSLYTWLTEQSLRELYLEPFRIAVQEGGATALMSSYNRVGAVWAGGSEALLTRILRNEWGFAGSVVTDYSDHHVYMNADQMIRAGGSLYMDGVFRDGTFMYNTTSANFEAQLKRATKDILYTWLNARQYNLTYNEQALLAGTEQLVRPIKSGSVSIVILALTLIDAVAAVMFFLGVHRYFAQHK